MASAINIPTPVAVAAEVAYSFQKDMRTRQQCIAEITEMIHVSHMNLSCFYLFTFNFIEMIFRIQILFFTFHFETFVIMFHYIQVSCFSPM